MPPMWGLGNFYRCCGQFHEQQVLDIADSFRKMSLPCDILGLEPGWQSKSYSCSYSWSERFPNHEKTLKKLISDGFKINLWEHAFTNPSAPFHDDLIPYSGDYLVWGGLVPDFRLMRLRSASPDIIKNSVTKESPDLSLTNATEAILPEAGPSPIAPAFRRVWTENSITIFSECFIAASC